MYFTMNKLKTRSIVMMATMLLFGVLNLSASESLYSHVSEFLNLENNTSISHLEDVNGITLTPNSGFATCLNSADGSATVQVSGGVNPMTFMWSTGETTGNIYSLLPGDYFVTVTDATGCTATATVTVQAGPEGIWLMPVSTPASCGSCDGTAEPDAMLGIPPYTYAWNDGQTTEVATGLCPGEYSVTVTDTQGCANSTTVFVGSQGNLNVTTSGTDAACSSNNGTATATPTGGVAPYTYNWSNGQTTATITNLSSGTYTVTVTSADGCQGVSTVTIGGGDSTLSGNGSSTPTDCGTNDGTASVSASGGSAPYTYSWSNGGSGTTISGLAPGFYSVTIMDSEGCTVVVNVEVVGSSAPNAGTISTNDPTSICAGDGIPDPITLAVTGSTAGATTQWVVTDADGNILALPGSNVIDLDGAGTGTCLIWYLVYTGNISGAEIGNNASDIEGCFDLSNNIPVERVSTEPATISTTDPTTICVGDMMDDFVDVSIDDAGTGSNSTWVITDANGIILGLPMMPPFNFEDAGIGNCLIWYLNFEDGIVGAEVGLDANNLEGCFSLSDPIEVIRQETAMVTIDPQDATICPGEELVLTATTAGTVTYEWLPSAGLLSNTDQAVTTYTMMVPGTYQIILTVTTDSGCMGMAMTDVTVIEADEITITDDPNGNTICNAGDAVNLTATSTDPDATFTWSASAGNVDANGTYTMMMPGTYTVTAESTNADGCVSTATTTVVVGIFDVTAEESSPISTCGGSDGEATATPNGGNGDFTYEWSNGSTDATATGLADGTYTVTVTDVLSGCTQEGTVVIESTGLSIGNYVWFDNSEDCLQDTNEQGIEGVPVNLMGPGPDGIPCNDDDEIIESTNTDADGLYLFECLEPGTYYIQFFATVVLNDVRYTCIDGDGSGMTGDMATNDDNSDSDVDPETGKTMPFDVLDTDGDGIAETLDMNGDGINDKDPLSFDAGVVEICNNVNNGGQVCCSQSVCAGEVPAKIESVIPAGGGGSAPIEYLWICSATGGVPNPNTWTNIPNSNTDCLQLGPAFETRYYARCARREGCPDFNFESNIIVIEVIACSQIVTFSTNMMSDETVQVSWITDNDAPGAMYNVERSADGANFEVLAHVASQAKDLSLYNYSDENPMKGMNYYRVRRIAQDGSYQFTEISQEMFRVKSETKFGIYPNPVTAELTLENLDLIEGSVSVEILSAAGVAKNAMTMDATSYTKEVINTNNLPSGVYFLRIIHGVDQVELIKFTKLN